jgi:glutathione peroxidase
MSPADLYGFKLKTLRGEERSLGDFRGKVLLVVNVASFCGYTPHYAGMQKLYEKYRDQGLEVLGFPANEFAQEEPGTDQEIRAFCNSKYHVTFPMFSKIVVHGPGIHPLYQWLTGAKNFEGPIEWNFEKFLIGRDGKVAGRFKPKVKPEAKEVVEAIEKELGKN